MRVSINWLKQYVDYDASPEDLAEKLTKAGIAVEEVEQLGEDLDKIVVGQITAIDSHPDADKLVVCQVDVKTEKLQIVTGADNISVDDKVPVALVGCKLPGGLKIKKAKLRGVESKGMLCSVEELELDENLFSKKQREGILILDKDAQVGQEISKALGLDDTVLVLELTPNRADCLSIINVAREVAVVTGGTLKLPEIEIKENDEDIANIAAVEIQDKKLCKRYAARVIKGMELKPSPEWMQKQLRAVGIRPISNIVDVTNYVMMEMGQPLHAFDYETIAEGKIVVRTAKQGEKLVTLDELERDLNENMLLIADPEKAVGLAGVMGGYNSEVTEKTTTVLLESAYFDGTSIRHTSRGLGLRSEASHRFEKGINVAGVVTALDRATQLLQELANGTVVGGILDEYPEPLAERQVTLRIDRVNQILGTSLTAEEIKEIFVKLAFNHEVKSNESIVIHVPPYRNDIELEVDLIEEVARIIGYDNIETSLPEGEITRGSRKFHQRIEDQVKGVLASSGLNEVVTYSFTSPKVFDMCKLSEEDALRKVIPIFNPLSEDHSVMRTTMIPSLLEVAAKNIKKRVDNVNIFELGRVFYPTDNLLPNETNLVAGLVSGKMEKGWDWEENQWNFYYLKGIVDTLMEDLQIQNVAYKPIAENPTFHPGRTAEIQIKEKAIGIIGEVHPDVLDSFNINQRCIMFQLNFDELLQHVNEDKNYQQLPKYPSVDRDLAFMVKDETLSDKLEAVIKNAAGELLSDLTLFDVYKGEQIKEGYKSLAYNLVYQAQDRTLTDEEVNNIHEKVRQALVEEFDADLR